ncbi:hypothetical protein EYZ11_004283 [Aspergillus tanneri]|uniref:DEAD/DEAH-box helicase domain-containing protein n=1 Tax=Aspergillus tanneri TaxID=1220188 RepID=A0A4S3JKX5_9EURO|nr:hypothetical protein EYZ11_004283 [Aspergillus tanneri]
MLKRIMDDPTRKAILVLPYVALVQEKLKWLRRIVQGLEKHVHDDDDDDEKTDLAKPYHQHWKKLQKSIRANSMINTAIEERIIGDLGVVVLDELHMLDDEHRGYLMELMVTKLLLLQQNIQIIAVPDNG